MSQLELVSAGMSVADAAFAARKPATRFLACHRTGYATCCTHTTHTRGQHPHNTRARTLAP